jgi:hypothetical protein
MVWLRARLPPSLKGWGPLRDPRIGCTSRPFFRPPVWCSRDSRPRPIGAREGAAAPPPGGG